MRSLVGSVPAVSLRYNFQKPIAKWGESYCIIIPSDTVKMMIGELKEDIHKRSVRVEVTL